MITVLIAPFSMQELLTPLSLCSIQVHSSRPIFWTWLGERKIVRITEQSEKSMSHYFYGATGGSPGKSGISSNSEYLKSVKTVGYYMWAMAPIKAGGYACRNCAPCFCNLKKRTHDVYMCAFFWCFCCHCCLLFLSPGGMFLNIHSNLVIT